MTVESQPGWVLLKNKLDAEKLAAAEQQSIVDDLSVQIDFEENETLPRQLSNLQGWENAGNSDPVNKASKIAEWKAYVKATRDKIAALKKTRDAEQRKLDAINAEITKLTRQIKAFEEKFEYDIMNGVPPMEAGKNAEEAAENAAPAGLSTGAIIAIAGGAVLVLGIVMYFIFRK